MSLSTCADDKCDDTFCSCLSIRGDLGDDNCDARDEDDNNVPKYILNKYTAILTYQMTRYHKSNIPFNVLLYPFLCPILYP